MNSSDTMTSYQFKSQKIDMKGIPFDVGVNVGLISILANRADIDSLPCHQPQ